MAKIRSLQEVIADMIASRTGGIWTALSGVVQTYYPDTQTADVQPIVKNPVMDPYSRDISYEELPVIPNVPVAFPRGGSFYVAFPLSAGDHVFLIFSELSNAEYRTANQLSEPTDVRRHSVGYPIAVPCAIADADALNDGTVTTGPLGGATIGKDGGERVSVKSTGIELGSTPTDFVALASLVQAELAKIAVAVPAYVPGLVASTVVKAK